MPRILSSALIAAALIFGLAGCGHEQGPSTEVASQPKVVTPTNPNDVVAWRAYMGKVADPQKQGVSRPYKFLVPPGDDPMAQNQRKQVEGALESMAAHNAFPGNVIAVGGPDPATTADVIVAAFGKAPPASLKTMTLLYIGDDKNQPRVQKVVAESGASYRYTSL